jgi:hypothetical protein
MVNMNGMHCKRELMDVTLAALSRKSGVKRLTSADAKAGF